MIHFHLPLDVPWNPKFIRDELTRRGIDAELAGFDIHIALSSARCKEWRDRHRDAIEFRLAKGLPDRPNLAIRHYPNRFLRNVELRRDVLRIPPHEAALILAQASVLDLGGILLDSIETEFEIALLHSKSKDALFAFRDRIEQLRTEKEKCIAALDFDAGASARDRELEVWNELESFLLHGAC
ncbi:MAG: hypothetical protein AAFX06_28990 [Planctomycetota bacterium]